MNKDVVFIAINSFSQLYSRLWTNTIPLSYVWHIVTTNSVNLTPHPYPLSAQFPSQPKRTQP